MTRTAFVNCLLLDGTEASGRLGMTVLVEGEFIVEVSSRRDFDADVEVVDLTDQLVMPGLVDCHIHFALWSLDLLAHQDEHISYLCGKTFRALREVLEAGCTAARDPGGLDGGFRDAVNDGIVPGPRIQTSVTIISPINGISDGTKRQGVAVPYLPGMPTPECTGPVEARAKVRETIRAGVDFIKIAISGGVSSPRRTPRQQLFNEDELLAIVDESHAWGRPVACHAIGGPGVLAAVRAGVDTIEHGVWLDDASIAEMVKRGTWYVPTFSAYELHAAHGGELQKAHAKEIILSHADSFRRAREAGVRITCGSDAGVYGHNFALELELLVSAGMSPREAIACATSKAAECLGWQREIGTISPGMRADLLLLKGDPTENIGILQDARMFRVMKSGAWVT